MSKSKKSGEEKINQTSKLVNVEVYEYGNKIVYTKGNMKLYVINALKKIFDNKNNIEGAKDMGNGENNRAHTNECATKEYVQKEHKETTRLIITVAFGMFGAVAVLATLLTLGFNFTVSSKLEEMKVSNEKTIVEMQKLGSEVQKLNGSVQALTSDQAMIKGYIMAKQPSKP